MFDSLVLKSSYNLKNSMNIFNINNLKVRVWSLVTLYILGWRHLVQLENISGITVQLGRQQHPEIIQIYKLSYLRLKIHLTVVSHLCLILLHTNSILDRRRIFGLWSKDILGNIELNWVCGYPINNTNTCFCHIIAVDRITHINIMQIRNKMITSHR